MITTAVFRSPWRKKLTNTIAFLDVLVTKCDNKFETSVYRKSTNSKLIARTADSIVIIERFTRHSVHHQQSTKTTKVCLKYTIYIYKILKQIYFVLN